MARKPARNAQAAGVQPRIVAAVGHAGGSGKQGGSKMGEEIVAAMNEAVVKAMANGIVQDDKLRELKLAARARVQKKYADEDAKRAIAAKAEAEKEFEGKMVPQDKPRGPATK